MSDPVIRTDADGVATIELHRPERKNAVTGPLLAELRQQLDAVGRDDSIGAVVLCGAGGSFCSGLDLDEYRRDPPPEWLAEAGTLMVDAHTALARCPQPIVVALERYAINAGAAYALAGDHVVVGETAWLQVGEARIGMNAPMNLAWLVARHSLPTVLRVVLQADRIAGPELVRLGLAHEVVADADVRTRAVAVATDLAAYPNHAARQMKQAVLRVAALDDPAGWFARAADLGSFGGPPPSRMH